MSIEINESSWLTDANLKAYYRFESGALTTDSSGETHTLTAISDPAEDASGKFGGAVALDSTDAYSIVDHADLKPAGVFTVGAWVKGSAGTTIRTVWNTFLSSGGNLYGFLLEMDATEKPVMLIAKGTGAVAGTDYKTITGGTTVLDETWHFVVGTWDGTNINIYVDGASDAVAVAAFNAAYTGTMYQNIGARNSAGTPANFFTGSLDDVFLMNGTALSAAQIENLYQDYLINVSAGSFALTSIDTAFNKTLSMVADLGTFALTGIDVVLQRGYTLAAVVGEFALTGIDVAFRKTLNMAADAGSFVLTGIASTFNIALSMAVSAGSFVLTSVSADLEKRLGGLWMLRTKPTTNWTNRTKPSTSWTNRVKP